MFYSGCLMFLLPSTFLYSMEFPDVKDSDQSIDPWRGKSISRSINSLDPVMCICLLSLHRRWFYAKFNPVQKKFDLSVKQCDLSDNIIFRFLSTEIHTWYLGVKREKWRKASFVVLLIGKNWVVKKIFFPFFSLSRLCHLQPLNARFTSNPHCPHDTFLSHSWPHHFFTHLFSLG